MIPTLYTIVAIITFFWLIYVEKKTGYVETDTLVLFTFMAIIWPVAGVLFCIVMFYQWLTKVVNKKS
jgi:hypothetical protein